MPISEEERRQRKRTVALTTAGISVAIGGDLHEKSMKSSCGGFPSSTS